MTDLIRDTKLKEKSKSKSLLPFEKQVSGAVAQRPRPVDVVESQGVVLVVGNVPEDIVCEPR